MKYILSILFLFPLFASAQTYRYIGVENGLSNRKIFDIKKDMEGYMWFLTNEGMDRYNGKEIKHYKLIDEINRPNYQIYLGWLYAEPQGGLWIIGKFGRIFRYDKLRDRFELAYRLPDIPVEVSYGYMDREGHVWLCSQQFITLYDTRTGESHQLQNILKEEITNIEQMDPQHFFIGTENGISLVELKDNNLRIIPVAALDKIQSQISELYLYQPLQRLFMGSFGKGIYVYDLASQQIIQEKAELSDVDITQITQLNDNELLFSTDGMGIYKMNARSCELTPYIVTNYDNYNEINTNNISDIYVDDQERIWITNYPDGITIVDNRYRNYNWIKHSMGNKQSLINDQVHTVIEDSDGDMWFGTNNGISLYKVKEQRWHSFLSTEDKQLKDKNHIFITLCEITPGVIWAGGYTSGIYKINKKDFSVSSFLPYMATANIKPDKYIRGMMKDSQGNVWSGGFYNLKCFNQEKEEVRLYPGINSVTAIIERNEHSMWIGTTRGLYLLEKESGNHQLIELPVESMYINSLYQAKNGLLYIGTNGAGLLIYDPGKKSFEHFEAETSALVSNSIYTILPEQDGYIMMSTDNGITAFSTQKKLFYNWTKEQGLRSACFNANSGILRKDKSFVFGSTDGAIDFPADTKLPVCIYSKMILSDLHTAYRVVYPGEKDSPLQKDINETDKLYLKYSQNTFSLKVSSINYDYPDNILFSWKLEGFYDTWNQPGKENLIRYTNLHPGKYTLRIRTTSREEPGRLFEERSIVIVIGRPIWFSIWALIIYAVIIALILGVIYRLLELKKQKKMSDEKTRFFINTAHDIRTPLTLIKAPIEELLNSGELSKNENDNMKTAMRNVNILLQMATNLINFERANLYSSQLYIAEYELNAYLTDIYQSFKPYAASKHIHFTYTCDFSYLSVWFDKGKMDSILKNILSNALKYTTENGNVSLTASESKENWKVVVKDTGIGIPAKEQKKLFKMHFRGSNAINFKISGSGIGLMLVRKLVRLHNGKITIESVERQGTTVYITIPKHKEEFRNYHLAVEEKEMEDSLPNIHVPEIATPAQTASTTQQKNTDQALQQRILIAEDNDELRNYLVHTLSETYNVRACTNGKEALDAVKEFWPELVLSDVMMPEMQGDELCVALKNDIETSHIPVLLLTALSDEQNILKGLNIGADEYIVKPFSIGILKATITNLLANRALLRAKYANMEPGDAIPAGKADAENGSNLDWKFMTTTNQRIEENMDNPDFNVDVLCATLGMSRTSFYNKLKSLTGQAPADYIRLFRLKHAAQLLKEGGHSIAEVATMTGFSDGKYFREVFKKHFGVSPSQYAKEDISTPPTDKQ